MTSDPFPPREIPRDPGIDDDVTKLGAALGHFRKENAKSDGTSRWDAILVTVIDGKWGVTRQPEPRNERNDSITAHERVVRTEALDQAVSASLRIAARFPTALCEKIRLDLRFEPTALRLRGRTIGTDVAIGFNALPVTLPIAAAAIDAIGTQTFLSPREPKKNGKETGIRELTKNGIHPRRDALSIEIHSPDVSIEDAIRNAFAHAIFIGALRDGVADPSDFAIEKIECVSANGLEIDAKIIEEMRVELRIKGVLFSDQRRMRQIISDQNRKTTRQR
jgi:hypothetical protein